MVCQTRDCVGAAYEKLGVPYRALRPQNQVLVDFKERQKVGINGAEKIEVPSIPFFHIAQS